MTVLEDGGERQITMKELRIGDMVKTMNARTKVTTFTPVILFAHRDADAVTTFTRLRLENGGSVTLSPNHLIFIGQGGKTKMAKTVVVNDEVILNSDEVSKVSPKDHSSRFGIFIPRHLCTGSPAPC